MTDKPDLSRLIRNLDSETLVAEFLAYLHDLSVDEKISYFQNELLYAVDELCDEYREEGYEDGYSDGQDEQL